MKQLRPSSQFKKDVKRIRNNPKKVALLMNVLRMLEAETELPAVLYPHMLSGDYAGCMECHIGSDYLLIWHDPHSDSISLLRLGSHSELFGKGIKR